MYDALLAVCGAIGAAWVVHRWRTYAAVRGARPTARATVGGAAPG
jgi:hypothetical protein